MKRNTENKFDMEYDSLLLRTMKKFFLNKRGLIGFFIVFIMLIYAVLGEPLMKYPSDTTDINNMMAAPSSIHIFGTDELGRDVYYRCITGIKITFIIGVCSVIVSMLIGTVLGLIAGYYKGKRDRVISSLMDVMWSFPTIIMALAITAALGSGMVNVFIAIGIVYIPVFERLVRSKVLSIRNAEYVQSARAIGLNNREIIFKYILPNLLSILIVQSTVVSAQAIIVEASLSYLGVGLQPPITSLGYMLKTGYSYLNSSPWMSIFPGICIMLIVLGLNFLGDGLRDTLDVKLNN